MTSDSDNRPVTTAAEKLPLEGVVLQRTISEGRKQRLCLFL